MKYKEFVEDLGGALAGGVDRVAAAIADLPGVLQDAYKETKAKIMQGVNRRKFYDWYNTNWKGTDKYTPKRAQNFADAIMYTFTNIENLKNCFRSSNFRKIHVSMFYVFL